MENAHFYTYNVSLYLSMYIYYMYDASWPYRLEEGDDHLHADDRLVEGGLEEEEDGDAGEDREQRQTDVPVRVVGDKGRREDENEVQEEPGEEPAAAGPAEKGARAADRCGHGAGVADVIEAARLAASRGGRGRRHYHNRGHHVRLLRTVRRGVLVLAVHRWHGPKRRLAGVREGPVRYRRPYNTRKQGKRRHGG